MKTMRIKMPPKFSVTRIFANKRFVVVFSLVLSFAIWISVMVNQNPIREQVFKDVTANISIDDTAASKLGLGIVSDISSQKFTVTLSGPSYVVSGLTTSDFILSADVSSVTAAGTYTLSIFGNRNSGTTGYTFKSISPATINVAFDYIDSKELVLTPKLNGVSAEEGLIAEAPVVSNSEQSTLTIKGPRALVERIASAGSLADVNSTLDSTQTFNSYVVLYDKNGNVVYRYLEDGTVVDGQDHTVTNNFLTLGFTSLKVTQPISKKVTLPVKAVFSNLPSGMTEDDIPHSIDHDSITVIGTPDVVKEMKSVTLAPIDITKVSVSSNKFEVAASLPEGVKLFDSVEYFTVTVDKSKLSERTFLVSEIKCTGVGSGYTAKSENASIKLVKMCGPKEIISNLKSSDLYAVADLSDKAAGSHTVDVIIKSKSYDNIWQVGTYSVLVNIK